MARTRVRWGRIGALLGVASAAAVLAGGHAVASNATPVAARHHVVRSGETVWSISRGIVGPEGDPRPVVDQVIAANHLRGADIVPGEHLIVPEGG